MAEIFKFFNSMETSPGVFDREYVESDFADYFGSVLSSGLLHTDEVPGMRVSVSTGTLNTVVSSGKAMLKGHLYENTSPLTLTHSIPEATLDRIDRIVLRLDVRNQSRFIKLFVKEGVPASTPIAPVLQRDNFIYEISLAQIRVHKNTVQLLPADLVDERLQEDLCGLVTWLPKLPTSQFQDQWDEFMAGIVDDGFASAAEFVAHKAEDAIHLATGTANIITVSTGGNYSYGQFKQLKTKAIANSTGNVTINVDGLGVKPALKFDGTQLATGAIKAGKVYDWYYDTASGGRFFLIAKASGTAVVGDVLAGKPFSNDDGEFVGAMPNQGAVNQSLTTQNQAYVIPAGYHNGAGKVQATYVAGKRFAMGTIPAMGSLNLVPTIYLPFVPKTVIVQCMQGVSTPNGAYATKDNSIYKVYSEQFHFGQSSGLRGTIILDDSASFVIAHTADNYPSYAMNWIAYE